MEINMYYVCIEDNMVVGIQNYQPEVPESVIVVQITDDEHDKLVSQKCTFDIKTKKVLPVDDAKLEEQEQQRMNGINENFLNETDWKVMRHIREKALGQKTSLSEEEYISLEKQRAYAASKISN
jgi:hypothetical protein